MKNFYNDNSQIVGTLKDGIYRKEVVKKAHFVDKYGGYGISDSIIRELKEDGCKEIRIREDKDKIYSSDIDQWILGDMLGGFELQRFLAVDKMMTKEV